MCVVSQLSFITRFLIISIAGIFFQKQRTIDIDIKFISMNVILNFNNLKLKITLKLGKSQFCSWLGAVLN